MNSLTSHITQISPTPRTRSVLVQGPTFTKKSIRFSAPAKVHVIGEHAVVYGKPAIISAINLRLALTVAPTRHSGDERSEDSRIYKIQTAIESQIKKTYKLKSIPLYQIEIKSDFPVGSGLGASAAISATLTAALFRLLKIRAGKQQIYDIALSGEKAIHGNPSGSDLAAVIFGGIIWFRKELPNLPLTSQIPLTLPTLFLVNSGKPEESTGVMVAKVAKLNAAVKKKTFDQIELLTKALATNSNDIKQIFKETNACLVKLGVVSKSTQQLINKIEKSGGAAKITGAGGTKSGSGMILIYHTQPEKLKGMDLIKIKLAQEGLRREA